MAKIQKRDIDWQSRKVRIEQGKTGNVKVIGPLAGKEWRYWMSAARHQTRSMFSLEVRISHQSFTRRWRGRVSGRECFTERTNQAD
jgi:hypothetical protein